MQIQKTHQNRTERTTYQGMQTVSLTSPTSLALLVYMPMCSYVFILVSVCMGLCASVHICIYVSEWVLIHVPWGLCASVCKHIFVCVCTCVRVHECFCVSVIVYVTLCVLSHPSYLCMCVHVFLGGYAPVHVSVCSCIYVYVCVCN